MTTGKIEAELFKLFRRLFKKKKKININGRGCFLFSNILLYLNLPLGHS